MSQPAEKTHAQRVDACLRRLLDALLPLQDEIDDAAAILGPIAAVSAVPRKWQRLRDAIADAEPWPLELLGPIQVLRTEVVDGKPESRPAPAWFTRGHHSMETFQLFAKSAARKRGFALASRPGMPTEQGFHAYFLPPIGDRLEWMHAGPSLDGVVPVTVWTPAE